MNLMTIIKTILGIFLLSLVGYISLGCVGASGHYSIVRHKYLTDIILYGEIANGDKIIQQEINHNLQEFSQSEDKSYSNLEDVLNSIFHPPKFPSKKRFEIITSEVSKSMRSTLTINDKLYEIYFIKYEFGGIIAPLLILCLLISIITFGFYKKSASICLWGVAIFFLLVFAIAYTSVVTNLKHRENLIIDYVLSKAEENRK